MNRHVSPEAVTRWLRSEPSTSPKCICCPNEKSHVYGYVADIVGMGDEEFETKTLGGEPSGRLDYQNFIHKTLRGLPEGTHFRVVIESL